ncbi:MAG: hypothetical protein FI707_00505 [SAR202 cluster bacterium]|jgi:hypothetical protein|nr:hypothetical protein [Chloroflexota bacterium]MDP6423001.1 hypothetical protein [SAR202 cluster bacterium]HAL46501.1 hypothetical protein [Dehalococcoidia bacterium]MDP6663322.1 hypothetical protein [SAR202 cluster bacterium]MDP6801309.1 hypothetical protein [SAR202 cluster bacterium]|tara:strand:- start:831 stop:1154 length:324 start_codon:yes stop_codon:yes gene_type:complete
MPKYNFQREVRTPFSECYTVKEESAIIGRLDVHFADVDVHATLTIIESLTQDDVKSLISLVEEDLLDAMGIVQQELVVHVHQGQDLGVYSSSSRDFNESNGGGLTLN